MGAVEGLEAVPGAGGSRVGLGCSVSGFGFNVMGLGWVLKTSESFANWKLFLVQVGCSMLGVGGQHAGGGMGFRGLVAAHRLETSP